MQIFPVVNGYLPTFLSFALIRFQKKVSASLCFCIHCIHSRACSFNGWAKELKLAQVNGLTGKTLAPLTKGLAKGAGILWLITCLLFLVTAVALLIKED
jgi:hypothetical protein